MPGHSREAVSGTTVPLPVPEVGTSQDVAEASAGAAGLSGWTPSLAQARPFQGEGLLRPGLRHAAHLDGCSLLCPLTWPLVHTQRHPGGGQKGQSHRQGPVMGGGARAAGQAPGAVR